MNGPCRSPRSGIPPVPFRICVLLARPSGLAVAISNQILGPVPPGTCALGQPSAADLTGITGQQYFVVEHSVAGVPDRQRLGARLSEPRPNPNRGTVQSRFDVPEPRHMRVEVVDLGGRRLRLIADGVFASGPHELRWDGLDSSGRTAPAGLY